MPLLFEREAGRQVGQQRDLDGLAGAGNAVVTTPKRTDDRPHWMGNTGEGQVKQQWP
jgi:hypothetical protein